MLKEFVKDKEREVLFGIQRVVAKELFTNWISEHGVWATTYEGNIIRTVSIYVSGYTTRIDYDYGEAYDAPVYNIYFRKTINKIDVEEYELEDQFEIWEALAFLITRDTTHILLEDGSPYEPVLLDLLNLKYDNLPF